jgi:ABC-type multidrug transport system ATPase subunit/ABC-type multidrug transport system permease subunit
VSATPAKLTPVCQSAAACVSGLSRFSNSSNAISSGALDTTMTCSAVPTVYAASQMACSVNQPTLQAIFPGTAELTISRFLNGSRTPGGDRALAQAGMMGGSAEAWAQLWLDGIEQFYCHATECNQTITEGSTTNSSLWECTKLACTCRPGTAFCGGTSTNLTGPINGLAGPLSVDCGDGGKCQFKQPFLNTLFGASGLTLSDCSFGECVEQYVIDQAMGIIGPSSGSSGLSGGVIAGLAVVGAILLAILLVTVWGLIVRNKARKAVDDGTLEKRGSGVGLAWSGVGYEVKAHGRGLYATTLSWLRGWGSPTSRARDQEDGGVGPNGGRIVLRDTRGDLPPGGFCCVLGPSGAGKSTLVDILAGKRKAGRVEGKVAYLDDGGRRVKIGYCDQSDVLSPTSTVLETLQFAAYLRLPENVPKAVKDARAAQVLRELGLEHIANTRVGSGEHRGISGGEMRRVSIGVELVADPDVLVLDEPTSGLDSVSAARIVSLLKNLAEEHRTTIVASIHQPSSALYHSFSQVLLLANGRQLYFGPGGQVPADFFAQHGYPCPPGYNVADHLLEIASENPQGLPTGAAAALSTRPASDSHASDDSAKEKDNGNGHYPPVKTLSRMSNEFDLAQIQQAAAERKWWPAAHPPTTFLTQLSVLARREWRTLMRDKTLLITHVLMAAITGVFAGGLYYNVSLTIAGFQNRVGSLFFLGALISFTSLSALNNMVEMRPLFLRERAGNYYSPQAWLVSRAVFDIIPLRILPTIIVSVILYFMVGLAQNAANFFKFLLIAVEFSIVMVLYNFLLASVFQHPSMATLLSSSWLLFNLVFAGESHERAAASRPSWGRVGGVAEPGDEKSRNRNFRVELTPGFFINISNIPPVLRWLRYLAPLGYMLEALTVNEVGSGLMIIDVLQGVPIEISAVPIMNSLFGFGEGHYYRNVLVLFAWIAGFLAMLVLSVFYFLREKR